MSTTETRLTLTQAIQEAKAFMELLPPEYTRRWSVAGSLRRRAQSIGDLEHVAIPIYRVPPSDDGALFDDDRSPPLNQLWLGVDTLLARGTIEKHIYPDGRSRWGDILRVITFRGRQHEVYMADENNWGSKLLIRTGPQEFSRNFVIALQRRGFVQRDGYVRDKDSWTCPCGFKGKQPAWEPGPGNYSRGTPDAPERAICPACRGRGVAPVIIPCPTEERAFDLAGMPWKEPEDRR